ncbi:hypothetical protein [Roseiflexus sp.]|uniref:hypothetical protein n=1 Tax=Roseiflexus sp. TaxID=2562120 RepID=UPI0025896018|nr:hypothetical protein [Roseiflexus sp.]
MRPHAQESADGRCVPAERATQEADYGWRGKGYVFGAFRPAAGDADTRPYDGRTIVNWVDFLTHVNAWVGAEFEHVYTIVDNLNVHRAADVLLFVKCSVTWWMHRLACISVKGEQ